jgi:two-component system NtrC family sensor kinase
MPALKHTGPRKASRRSSARFEREIAKFARSAEILPLEKLPQLLCTTARRLTGASGAAYWQVVDAASAFECAHAEGCFPRRIEGSALPLLHNGTVAEALRRRLIRFTNTADGEMNDALELKGRATAAMVLPVTCRGGVAGMALLIHSRERKKFDERDAEQTAALAAITSSRLERHTQNTASAAAYSSDALALVDYVKKQWMEVIDTIVDFIVVHDEQHRVLRLNRSLARFIGVQPSQLVGVSMSELARRAGLDGTRPCLFCSSGSGVAEEYALTARERTYLVSGSQVHAGADGLRTVHVLKDITDAATLRAQLLHAEKLASIGQLVAGMAHEVNNPLTAIIGFADLLVEDPEIPEGARKELRLILQEAERTKAIVQDLLHFSRPTLPDRGPVDVHEIIRRVLMLRSYDFKNEDVEVVTRLDEDLPEVLGDTHQLQQVILNIVNNAIDATREVSRRGRIEIETLAKDSGIEILVRDNGPGIAKPDRIFDPFFTTKEPGQGTGLGLSICYGIMQAHGGEIHAMNNAPDFGCTFVLRLHNADTEAGAAEMETVQAASRAGR